MTSITSSPLQIQACTQSVPALPGWFGELTLIIHHMQRQGVLAAIKKQVHFARRRFGRYELIDFVAVLFGYAISGERTLEAFYERVQPGPARLWPSLDVRACLLVRRSVVFSLLWTRLRWKPYARSFSLMCWLGL